MAGSHVFQTYLKYMTFYELYEVNYVKYEEILKEFIKKIAISINNK